jgi:hypothetical protein
VLTSTDHALQVGDRIAIASSSVYAYEVDEATITSITTDGSGNTVIGLDTALGYTHIGAIHSQSGVVGGEVDMRAEVAVLTRNILLTGDADSEKYMYGMQVRTARGDKAHSCSSSTAACPTVAWPGLARDVFNCALADHGQQPVLHEARPAQAGQR